MALNPLSCESCRALTYFPWSSLLIIVNDGEIPSTGVTVLRVKVDCLADTCLTKMESLKSSRSL